MKCFKKKEEFLVWQYIGSKTGFVNERTFHTMDGVIIVSCACDYDPRKNNHVNYIDSQKGDWITQDIAGIRRAYDETMFNRLFNKVK